MCYKYMFCACDIPYITIGKNLNQCTSVHKLYYWVSLSFRFNGMRTHSAYLFIYAYLFSCVHMHILILYICTHLTL